MGITSKDIAALAGVSQTTVSFVLNNRMSSAISQETREHVLAIAQELGYHISKRKRKKAQITIGLMVPTLSNFFYPMILQSIEADAKARGVHFVIMDILRDHSNESVYLDMLKNGTVNGILSLFLPNTPIPQELPVVAVGELDSESTMDIIALNSHKAGYLLADHLIQQGHTHFAYISTPFSNAIAARQKRLEGICARLKESGLENNITVLANSVEIEISDSSYEFNVGYQGACSLLAQKSDVTAVIAGNDTIATGCVKAYSEHAIRIPEDIALAGFGDLPAARLLSPQLTSVDQMAIHACHMALNVLVEKIENPSGHSTPVKLEYQPNLCVRASTLYKRSAE